MHPSGKTRRAGPGLTGEDWWGAFELAWPRPTYQILETPGGSWGDAWAAIPQRRVPFLAPPPPGSWVRVGHEVPVRRSLFGELPRVAGPSAAETVVVYRLDWPAGGIFAPEEKPHAPARYEPLKVAPDILLDAQRVAPEDPQALLGFVNRWGCLGVGIPGADDFGADGVLRTGQCLRELTQWIGALYALQHGTPTPITWADLATLFQARLAGVQVGARPTRRGLVPLFPLTRLLDALYLEFWGLATDAKRLRQCQRCKHFFIRGRRDQIFCTGRCARLWHVKRWKQRARQKRKRLRHQREVS